MGDLTQRTDLSGVLGHLILEPVAEQVCREYGLEPRGEDPATGLAKAYLGYAAGVELTADGLGRIITVFLHFHGDDGFTSYRGGIPGAGDAEPTRSGLRAALGEPAGADEPYADRFLGDFGPCDHWVFPSFVLHAQYALDAERLHRITLKLPEA